MNPELMPQVQSQKNLELQLSIIQLVTNIGLDAATSILKGMKNASTIDDAIKALEDAQKITWAQAKVSQQS